MSDATVPLIATTPTGRPPPSRSAAPDGSASQGDREVFLDARGEGRALQVRWTQQAGRESVAVISLWQDGNCVASFRMPGRDVPVLIEALTSKD